MATIKQILALVGLSLAIIFAMSYAQQGIQLLLAAHDYISLQLQDVFTGGQAGNIARGLISLLALPVIIALIPTLIYWMIRRHWFPYFIEIIWVVWLVQTGALLVMYKVAGM